MGSRGGLRLFPGLLLLPASDRAGPPNSSRETPLLAVTPGSTTAGARLRSAGNADFGRRFALVSTAALREFTLVRADQHHPVDSPGAAILWRKRTAQVDRAGDAGTSGGGQTRRADFALAGACAILRIAGPNGEERPGAIRVSHGPIFAIGRLDRPADRGGAGGDESGA